MADALFARWRAEDTKEGGDVDEDAPRVMQPSPAWAERRRPPSSPARSSSAAAASPRRAPPRRAAAAPPSPARSSAWEDHASQTTAKVSSILAFLDDAEQDDGEDWVAASSPGGRSRAARSPARSSRGVPASVGSPLSSRGGGGGGVARSGLANEVFDGVRSKLLDMRVEVEEKTRMVAALKAKLIETKKKAKTETAKLAEEKDAVQSDAEQAINRQLAFIDRLLGDKKALGEKNSALISDAKAAALKFEEASDGLKRRHAVEIRKAKDKWSAAERVKREKWAKEKMKSIKDSTIQGLAPEIQRLISTHQAELRRLRATHGKEMLVIQDGADKRISEMSRRQHAELQKQLSKASEDTISTIETRVTRHEEQHAVELKSVRERHAEEKTTIELRARSEREELESVHRRAMERLRRDEDQAKQKLRARIDAIQEEGKRTVETHTARTKDELEREQQAWVAEQRRKMEAAQEKREAVIRAQMQERLDGELKMVIEKMAKDGLRAQDEVKRRSNARADRLEDELDSERARAALKTEQLEQRCEELADRISGLSEDLSLARREREAAQNRVLGLEKRLAQSRAVSRAFSLHMRHTTHNTRFSLSPPPRTSLNSPSLSLILSASISPPPSGCLRKPHRNRIRVPREAPR